MASDEKDNKPELINDGVMQSLEAVDSSDPSILSAEIVQAIGQSLGRSITATQRTEVEHVITEVVTRHTSFSGPIPPPQILKEYAEIYPDGAKVIVDMALREQAARHEHYASIDRANHRAIDHENKNANYRLVGLVLGAFIVLCIVGIGAYALYLGYPKIAASCLGVGLLGGVARIFIRGNSGEDTDENATKPQHKKPAQRKKKR
jgi:uncharacterized membrane protein